MLGGDPCFDRMLAALPYRERFRRALDVRPGQRLVVLNSTWNPESLFGDGDENLLPGLLPRLTSELPADEYRIAAVLHPNTWFGHGPGQVRAWLDRARRAGLALVDPLHHWRQAILAADAVIGDHGAVSYYAAALGTPVLLGAAPLARLDPDSPVAAFVAGAPRLETYAPLAPQLDQLIAGHEPLGDPAKFVTSVPGEAATLLRRLFYALLERPEPVGPAFPVPLPLPPYEPAHRTAPVRVVTRRTGGPGEVSLTRHADPRGEPLAGGEVHTAVHEDVRGPERLALADVIHRAGSPDDRRFGGPARWTAEILGRFPQCGLAAYVTGPDGCTARTRDGALWTLNGEGGEGDRDDEGADPAVYASALYACLDSWPAAELIANGLAVRTGSTVHRVRVRQLAVD
ncbi:hypothetical protein ACIQM4_03440 [Streptomyces sp. NPDC091272]|uniref:hypothetical protein n=1 Tax=Streptomyces sp. NPDC091272 TaxID=3365981 RepID=UPI003814B838